MLATRVIPALLQRGATLVKGKRFESWRSVGHVRQAVRIHNARGVDELIYLDIGATPEGRGPDFAMVEQLAKDCYMPLTVGGGVRSVEDVRQLLARGADKVAICTAIMDVVHIIKDCADRFGSQAIVAAVDYAGQPAQVTVGCGRRPLETDGIATAPSTWARMCQQYGAGEILLTSIDREGTMEGYDLELIRAVSAAVDIPVIAHGGCSGYPDMAEAIRAGASAVAAGALFQFSDATPKEAATYLHQVGIEARVA